jgi:hypothetical protein
LLRRVLVVVVMLLILVMLLLALLLCTRHPTCARSPFTIRTLMLCPSLANHYCPVQTLTSAH